MLRVAFAGKSWVLPVLLLPFLAGCGGGTSVSGSVTYNGQPVPKGYVAFYPMDGKGPTVGGQISNGKYAVKGVTPGKNRVEVSSQSDVKAPDSMDEGIKHPVVDKDAIPAGAEGNNQVVDVTAGQTLDLALKPPTKK
jgi:hypothetical protein